LEGKVKIAFSADLHLTSQAEHPERYLALEAILRRMSVEGIPTLIIAGDLFDSDAQAYTDFEKLINKKVYSDLSIHIIKGNHDSELKHGMLKCDAVTIHDDPSILKEAEFGVDLLLVPYDDKKTLGEVISAEKSALRPKAWVLVSHGDWLDGSRDADPYEPGVYMPLTRKDMASSEPALAVLGHIHKAVDARDVVIPGSPCGLNITETGVRSFVVLDTDTHKLERIPLETDVIFLDERLVLYSMPDEVEYVSAQVKEVIESWGIPKKLQQKIILRLRVEGYCSNPQQVKETVLEGLKAFETYKDEGVDFYGLQFSGDLEKNAIAASMRDVIGALHIKDGSAEPEREQILLSALDVIYGGKK
jgi:DNA repair protein SbcD/Mre11